MLCTDKNCVATQKQVLTVMREWLSVNKVDNPHAESCFDSAKIHEGMGNIEQAVRCLMATAWYSGEQFEYNSRTKKEVNNEKCI